MIQHYKYACISNQTQPIKYSSAFARLLLKLLLLVTLQAGAQCPPNMIHYFPFDEKQTGTYTDKVAGLKANCADCPAPVASMFAGAQQFNGKLNGLTITEKETFEWGHFDSFTIEFWVKVTGSSSKNQVIIGRRAKDSGMGWWVGVNPEGNVVFELYDMKRSGFWIEKAGKKINDGKWHHIVAMRHGTHLRNRLYIDGYKVADFRYEYSDNFFSAAPVTIGYYDLDAGYHFNGAVDELMIYNRALDETEVRTRYGEGASIYCGSESIVPVITSSPVTFGVASQPYIYDVQAIGNPAVSYTLKDKPQGMSINGTTGEITWTPTAIGSYRVTVIAQNSAGQAQQSFDISVKNNIEKSTGLRHHWMLHEMSGTRFQDYYTPYDATCEPEARPQPIPGVISGGQRFDGKTMGLDVKSSYNFDWDADESFSIELWTRTTASGTDNQVMIGRSAADSDMQWWIGMDRNGYAAFNLLDYMWQGKLIGGTGPKLNDGKWHQVVAIKDAGASTNRLYVDGVKIAEAGHSYQHSFASLSPVNMGYLNVAGKYRYTGDLDEVKLFGRVLTDAEIKERYTSVYDGIVELIKFEGKYENSTVKLHWETQTETELDKFIVERSEDGTTFTEIGTVEASGTSSALLAYDFTDASPVKGISYYRLKIVKESGTFTYSNIVIIEFGGSLLSLFFVYPNPTVGGDVRVEVTNLKPEEKLTLMLSNLAGKRILQQDMQVESTGKLDVTLQVPETLSAGIYLVTIITDSKTLSRKLVLVD
ncbi:LamG-like jellyroll fold domain-containing protein [Pontibacter sp. H259]|uniref:LamG-like jellyroll fold domain-containing protein n=1 Tax=Pontibacter sp. H259 TaxID=3133421 RepID=UPI0030C31E1A